MPCVFLKWEFFGKGKKNLQHIWNTRGLENGFENDGALHAGFLKEFVSKSYQGRIRGNAKFGPHHVQCTVQAFNANVGKILLPPLIKIQGPMISIH